MREIEFKIKVDIKFLDDKEVHEFIEPFYKQMTDTPSKGMTLNELIFLLKLNSRHYLPISIEFPEMTHDARQNPIQIEIIG